VKARKKPIVVEAFQWLGDRPLPEPLVANRDNNPMTPDKVEVETLEGWLTVTPGDWIITGVKGERYPCKPDIFAATYEEVESKP
jgi:hypothetical protein